MSDTITRLLRAWKGGHREAVDELIPLVYQQLQELARRKLSRESSDHTLRPTELVHELYVRLVRTEMSVQNRAHFYVICARLMRRILIDHSRASLRKKRGGGAMEITLNGFDVAGPDAPEQMACKWPQEGQRCLILVVPLCSCSWRWGFGLYRTSDCDSDRTQLRT